MSNWNEQATRPTQPRPAMMTAGERLCSPFGQDARVTARVNPLRVQIQDGRGLGYIGNLDEMIERERQRGLGGTLGPAPAVKPVLEQEPGMQNIINQQDNRRYNSSVLGGGNGGRGGSDCGGCGGGPL